MSERIYVGKVDHSCSVCGDPTPVKVYAWTDPDADGTLQFYTSADTQDVWIHFLDHSIEGDLDD